jgi:hypothetical protein
MRGEFGNKGPNWDTLEEWIISWIPNRQGLIHIRNREPGGATYYNVKPKDVGELWRRLGCSWRTHYLAEMAPTEKTLFQGEVQLQPGGLALYYTTVALPMRDALRQESHSVKGIISNCLLRRFLCPNSHDWLMTLLRRYPDHVIEFSSYSTNWGTLPNFNTVFWEVRNY